MMVALLLLPGCLFAQYGVLLDAAAGETPLSFGTAVRLVGAAWGSVVPTVSAEESRATLVDLGFRVPRRELGGPVTAAAFAQLLIQVSDMRTGLAYGLIPSAGRAHDWLQRIGVYEASLAPGALLGGPAAIRALSRLWELHE